MLRKERKPKSKGAREIVTLDIKRWRQILDLLKNSKKATIVYDIGWTPYDRNDGSIFHF